MIKVCHITTQHNAFDDRIFYKECVYLAKDGFQVYLLQEGDSQIRNNVNVIGIGDRPKKTFERIIKFNKDVCNKALELNCDIYHIHDPELLLNYIIFKRKGKKVVFDSHEFTKVQIINNKNHNRVFNKIFGSIYSIIERFVLKRIDAVISVCTIDGKEYFDGKCKNVVTIKNYAVLDEFYNKKKNSINNKENIVCYVGGMTESRGIKDYLKACNSIGVKLVLAGPITDKFKKEIATLLEYKNVKYEGVVNRDKVFDILNISKIGLCILHNVGQYNNCDIFGVKVYEYLSMGLPVILAESKFNNKMIEKYKFGLTVKSNDYVDIANAISKMLNNTELLKTMSENAKKYIENNNWNIEFDKLVELYNVIMK